VICVSKSVTERAYLTIVVAYNILVTGRLLIACYVGAKHAGELAVQQEAQRVIQAASLLLHMMVVSMPIALGAAEVLDETCRGGCRTTSKAWVANIQCAASPSRNQHGP
jgi:hypothetical protein